MHIIFWIISTVYGMTEKFLPVSDSSHISSMKRFVQFKKIIPPKHNYFLPEQKLHSKKIKLSQNSHFWFGWYSLILNEFALEVFKKHDRLDVAASTGGLPITSKQACPQKVWLLKRYTMCHNGVKVLCYLQSEKIWVLVQQINIFLQKTTTCIRLQAE